MTPPPRANVLGLRYADLAVRVESVESSHLAWLQEFLSPWFAPLGGAVPDRRVVLEVDPARHEALLRAGARPGGRSLPCFVLDGEVVEHPEWQHDGDGRVILDQRHRVFYAVNPDVTLVRVLATDDAARARGALMRVVRELAMVAAARRETLLLHAAAFAIGGHGTAIVGAKGAGKTTLLLHALQAAGAEYVTNDRALVSLEDPRPRVRGLPTIVIVQAGTIRLFPELAAGLRAFNHARTGTEAAPPAPVAGRAVSVAPARLCAVTGVPPVAEVELRTIVFPRIGRETSRIRLERLTEEESASRLAAGLLHARAPEALSVVFAGPDDRPPERAALARRCAALARRVACYACETPPLETWSPQLTQELGGRLGGAGNEP